MPLIIDTHAHLDDPAYSRDLDAVVQRALEEDVWIITVGHDLTSSRRAVEIAERYPMGVFAAVGIHPQHVKNDLGNPERLIDIDAYKKLALSKKVVAIGECGLDYKNLPEHATTIDREYFQADLARRNQKAVFKIMLGLAKDLRLPLLIHARDCEIETISMINEFNLAESGFDARGIVHSFSADFETAKAFWNLGFLTSMTGHVTHGAWSDSLIAKSPLSRLAIESDCPYLTPKPWGMRRNEPVYTISVVRAIAGIKGERFEDVAKEISKNVMGVLKLEERIANN